MRWFVSLVPVLVAAPLFAEPCNPYRGCVPDPFDPYWAVTGGPGSALEPSTLTPPAWYTTPSPAPTPAAFDGLLSDEPRPHAPPLGLRVDDEVVVRHGEALAGQASAGHDVPEPAMLVLVALALMARGRTRGKPVA